MSKVELEEGHFAYPSRPDTAILKGLSLKVGLGQTLALVGASGCGKSTIISLLERFYDLDNGRLVSTHSPHSTNSMEYLACAYTGMN